MIFFLNKQFLAEFLCPKAKDGVEEHELTNYIEENEGTICNDNIISCPPTQAGEV